MKINQMLYDDKVLLKSSDYTPKDSYTDFYCDNTYCSGACEFGWENSINSPKDDKQYPSHPLFIKRDKQYDLFKKHKITKYDHITRKNVLVIEPKYRSYPITQASKSMDAIIEKATQDFKKQDPNIEQYLKGTIDKASDYVLFDARAWDFPTVGMNTFILWVLEHFQNIRAIRQSAYSDSLIFAASYDSYVLKTFGFLWDDFFMSVSIKSKAKQKGSHDDERSFLDTGEVEILNISFYFAKENEELKGKCLNFIWLLNNHNYMKFTREKHNIFYNEKTPLNKNFLFESFNVLCLAMQRHSVDYKFVFNEARLKDADYLLTGLKIKELYPKPMPVIIRDILALRPSQKTDDGISLGADTKKKRDENKKTKIPTPSNKPKITPTNEIKDELKKGGEPLSKREDGILPEEKGTPISSSNQLPGNKRIRKYKEIFGIIKGHTLSSYSVYEPHFVSSAMSAKAFVKNAELGVFKVDEKEVEFAREKAADQSEKARYVNCFLEKITKLEKDRLLKTNLDKPIPNNHKTFTVKYNQGMLEMVADGPFIADDIELNRIYLYKGHYCIPKARNKIVFYHLKSENSIIPFVKSGESWEQKYFIIFDINKSELKKAKYKTRKTDKTFYNDETQKITLNLYGKKVEYNDALALQRDWSISW
ncbi:hypothetical protein [Campylobacter ureolyticus]|uniref:Uncharacterized protein n=1 Tax=Campylobacter ureolyticus TaxID=827 RepID=A0A9Q4PU72_9BACT|nr:hypothetical protein [Campylobacter ureolyticus]MCZ6159026.1 hypothetical protein [Campylobacter ureolyticus]